jgi:hypothetical protein
VTEWRFPVGYYLFAEIDIDGRNVSDANEKEKNGLTVLDNAVYRYNMVEM